MLAPRLRIREIARHGHVAFGSVSDAMGPCFRGDGTDDNEKTRRKNRLKHLQDSREWPCPGQRETNPVWLKWAFMTAEMGCLCVHGGAFRAGWTISPDPGYSDKPLDFTGQTWTMAGALRALITHEDVPGETNAGCNMVVRSHDSDHAL